MSRRLSDDTAAHERTTERSKHPKQGSPRDGAREATGRLRSWLRTGLAALAVSALGLGVAGSVLATGHAQHSTDRPAVTVESAEPSVAQPSAFDRREDDSTSRDAGREALDSKDSDSKDDSQTPETGDLDSKALKAQVAERAERRSEELRKASGAASQASQKAAEKARTKDLRAAQKSVEKNDDRLQAAAVAKAEAEKKKQEQEQAQADQSQAGGSADQGGSGSDQQAAPAPNATDDGDSSDAGSSDAGSGKATLPLANYSVAARFGQVGSWARYHTGFDFSAPIGSPIRAADSGTVTNAGSGSASGWAGTYVTIKHSDGTQSLYAHMSSVAVSVGQQVSGGAHIGNVGVTGRSFGPHCHFEIYPAGVEPGDVYRAINPETWLQARGLNP